MGTDSGTSLLPTGRSRLLLRLCILMLLGFIIARLAAPDFATRMGTGDFVEYWASARIFLGGGNPYSAGALLPVEKDAGWTGEPALVPFNPPWTLLIVLPFSLLPFWPARIAWFLLNLLLLLAAADWIWLTYGGAKSHRWAASLSAMIFVPAAMSLHLGQISPLVLSGVVGFLAALKRNRGALAGASTVLVTVKPHVIPLFWLFLFLWVLRKRRSDVLWGAAFSLLLVALAVFVLNPSVYRFYLNLLTSGTGPMAWQTPTWGVALRLLLPGSRVLLNFLPTLIGLVLGLVLWIAWRSQFDWERHLPTILLVSSITAGYTWTFDWIILFPVVILILIHFLANQPRYRWIFTTLVFMQGILIIQNFLKMSNFYTIWLPPALAVLHWLANRLTTGSTSRSESSTFVCT